MAALHQPRRANFKKRGKIPAARFRAFQIIPRDRIFESLSREATNETKENAFEKNTIQGIVSK